MKTRTITLMFSLILIGISCDQIDYTQEAADIPIVQSFLAPGQSPLIKITRIIPYAAEDSDTLAVPISGLAVYLSVKGTEYLMAEDSSGSGEYVLAGKPDLIVSGDTVEFHMDYKGAVVSASTVIPEAPVNLKLSATVLYYTSGDPSSWLSAGKINLTWDNPDEDYYYLTIQNIETDPTPLNEMAENMPKFGSSPPSIGDEFSISMRNITYLGTHQVIIYHVNHEFAELFDNPGMSTVAMTEPPTNITNGLGIFTAMYSDTLYFEVKKQ